MWEGDNAMNKIKQIKEDEGGTGHEMSALMKCNWASGQRTAGWKGVSYADIGSGRGGMDRKGILQEDGQDEALIWEAGAKAEWYKARVVRGK